MLFPFLYQKQSKQNSNNNWTNTHTHIKKRKQCNDVHALNIWDCKHAYSIRFPSLLKFVWDGTRNVINSNENTKIRKQCTSQKYTYYCSTTTTCSFANSFVPSPHFSAVFLSLSLYSFKILLFCLTLWLKFSWLARSCSDKWPCKIWNSCNKFLRFLFSGPAFLLLTVNKIWTVKWKSESFKAFGSALHANNINIIHYYLLCYVLVRCAAMKKSYVSMMAMVVEAAVARCWLQ